MSTHGRHALFLQIPQHAKRHGRHVVGGSTPLLNLSPVVAGAERTSDQRRTVTLAPEDTAFAIGNTGILVYENIFEAYHGFERDMTIHSDAAMVVRVGKPCQMVHGTEIRLEYRNIEFDGLQAEHANGFEENPLYTLGVQTVVDLEDLAVGDRLGVGPGDIEAPGGAKGGLWKKVNTDSTAWMRVVSVQPDLGVVQATFLH